jgi:hypothetical protein
LKALQESQKLTYDRQKIHDEIGYPGGNSLGRHIPPEMDHIVCGVWVDKDERHVIYYHPEDMEFKKVNVNSFIDWARNLRNYGICIDKFIHRVTAK